MSKVKGTKRKSTSSNKSEPKLPGIKMEPGSLDTDQNQIKTDSLNPNQNNFPSNKNNSVNIEMPPSSSNEPSVSINFNKEPCDTFSNYMKNAILEEVLNAKKAALLQSPQVMKLLRNEQLKKQKKQ